jgi:hypothetical protein
MDEWRNVDVGRFVNVVVRGGNPVTDQSRDDYFDALFHSSAVIGLNTSAFLEAGIVGRPVLAILPPEYHENQEGTLHFRYLTDVSDGLLQASRSLDEHLPQLGAALGAAAAPHRGFVETFLRPYGLDVAATPKFASAVEELGTLRVASDRHRPSLLGRASLGAILAIGQSPKHRAWLFDEAERRYDEWQRQKGEIRSKNRRAQLTPEQQAEAEREMRAHRANP